MQTIMNATPADIRAKASQLSDPDADGWVVVRSRTKCRTKQPAVVQATANTDSGSDASAPAVVAIKTKVVRQPQTGNKFPLRSELLKLKQASPAETNAASDYQSKWIRQSDRKWCIYGSDCYNIGIVHHDEKFTHHPICKLSNIWKCVDPQCENSNHRVRNWCIYDKRCTNADCQFMHTTICPQGKGCPFFKAGRSCVNLHLEHEPQPDIDLANTAVFPQLKLQAVSAWLKPLQVRVEEPPAEETDEELRDRLLASECLTAAEHKTLKRLTAKKVDVPYVELTAEEERRASSCLSSPVLPRVQPPADVPVPHPVAPLPCAVAPLGMIWTFDPRFGWCLYQL